jgi:hypothetical protein
MYAQANNGLGQAQTANYAAQTAVPPPSFTLASALSRSEGLNERICQGVGRLGEIAAKLGALHPADDKKNPASIPNGVVGRLNEAADFGHERMSEIEALLSGIERALG